jgi:HEAT repeat protein
MGMQSILIDELTNDNLDVRRRALYKAMLLHPDERSEALYTAIANQFTVSDCSLRELASEALLALRCDNLTVLPVLTDALSDQSPKVRETALQLVQLFQGAEGLKPVLFRMLSDPVYQVRIRAAQAYWKHFHDSQVILPVVLEGLSSEQPDGVIQAAQLAAELVDESDKGVLIDALRVLLERNESSVRGNALYALSRLLNDREQLRILASSVKDDPDSFVQFVVAKIMTVPK